MDRVPYLPKSRRKSCSSSLPSPSDDRAGLPPNLPQTPRNPLLRREATSRAGRRGTLALTRQRERTRSPTEPFEPRRRAKQGQRRLMPAHTPSSSTTFPCPFHHGSHSAATSRARSFGENICPNVPPSLRPPELPRRSPPRVPGACEGPRFLPTPQVTPRAEELRLYAALTRALLRRRGCTYLSPSPGRSVTALRWLAELPRPLRRTHRAIRYNFA